jgi:hypothetical protein
MVRLNLVGLRAELFGHGVEIVRRVNAGCDALVNREIEEALHGAYEGEEWEEVPVGEAELTAVGASEGD